MVGGSGLRLVSWSELQPVAIALTRTAIDATARPFDMRCLMNGLSEAEVKPEDEVRGRRECLELGRGIAAVPNGEVALRIRPPIICPRLQVARGENKARVSSACQAKQGVRQLEDRRYLTPLHERTRLEKAIQGLRRILKRCHDHRLLFERRTRVHQSIAIVPAHAANALRVVVPFVAAAPI